MEREQQDVPPEKLKMSQKRQAKRLEYRTCGTPVLGQTENETEWKEHFPTERVILRDYTEVGNLCLVVKFASGKVVRRGSENLQISLRNRPFIISHCEV